MNCETCGVHGVSAEDARVHLEKGHLISTEKAERLVVEGDVADV